MRKQISGPPISKKIHAVLIIQVTQVQVFCNIVFDRFKTPGSFKLIFLHHKDWPVQTKRLFCTKKTHDASLRHDRAAQKSGYLFFYIYEPKTRLQILKVSHQHPKKQALRQ